MTGTVWVRMLTVRSRLVVLLGRGLAAAVCALAGHAVLVGSVRPGDPTHRYLAWYEPVVAGLSLAVVVGLGSLFLLGVLGRAVPIPRVFRSTRSFHQIAVGTAASGVALLVAQEAAERSFAAHTFAVPSVVGLRWALALAIVFATGAALAFLRRLGERAVDALLRGKGASEPTESSRSWHPQSAVARRLRPLALHAALRAPPALLSA